MNTLQISTWDEALQTKSPTKACKSQQIQICLFLQAFGGLLICAALSQMLICDVFILSFRKTIFKLKYSTREVSIKYRPHIFRHLYSRYRHLSFHLSGHPANYHT